jgi:opacity protein-like surface antigen
MKQLLSALLLLFVSLATWAQPSAGNISIGGTFNLQFSNIKNKTNSTSVEGPSTFTFNLSPSAEYYLAQNLSAGLGLGYTFTKTSDYPNSPNDVSKNSSFNIMPFARMYYNLGEKVNVFGQASINLGFGKTTNETTVGGITTSTFANSTYFSIGLQPGLQYFITNNLSLEATVGFLGYNINSTKSGNRTNSNSSLQLSFSSGIGFGVKYFLK